MASQQLEAPPPARLHLATVLVAPYQQLRVLATCGFSAQGTVEVTLTHVHGEAAVAPLDQFTLVPNSSVDRLYTVPGVVLAVSAGPTGDAPTDVDVVIWGYRIGDGAPPSDPIVPPVLSGTLVVNVVLDDGSGGPGPSAGPNVEIRLDGVTMGFTGADGSFTIVRTASEYSVEAVDPSGKTGAIAVSILPEQTTETTLVIS